LRWLFFQGPNIYGLLSSSQQATVARLNASDRLNNFVDDKDLIAIGYGEDQATVGRLLPVLSQKTSTGSFFQQLRNSICGVVINLMPLAMFYRIQKANVFNNVSNAAAAFWVSFVKGTIYNSRGR